MRHNNNIQLALGDGRSTARQAREGNWFSRHPKLAVGLGALGVGGGLTLAAVHLLGGETTPSVGIHMTLTACEDGRRDTRPQHMGLYEGQKITIGVGDSALHDTVTIEMEKGGRLKQDQVDKGVTLVTGDGPQPEPGQAPTGTTLEYTLGKQAEVTITAHASPDPLVTDIAIIRAC